MERVINEYVRVTESISLGERDKENLYCKVMENMSTGKYETKKQIAVASVAVLALAVCVSYFVRSGNKLR